MEIVAVGEIVLDVEPSAAPVSGGRTHAPIRVRAGGSPVNVARAAVSAGARALVVGRIGADAAGSSVGAELAAAGIDAHLAADPSLPTGTVVTMPGGVVADRGASAAFSPADVPAQLVADVVVVSGYALLPNDSRAGARTALERCTAAWIAVDAASAGLCAACAGSFAAIAGGANAVLASMEEAHALTGLAPEEAARELGSTFRLACVKLGGGGAVAVLDGVMAYMPAGAAGPRLGDGDAFAAGLLLALARGSELGEALAEGHALAARA